MKLKEAYQILNLDINVSKEDLKKRYKELTKKFHPDINKDPDAEKNFKKINEAYARIQDGSPDQEEIFSETININPFDLFNNLKNKKSYDSNNIIIYSNISFSESILGIKKEISYKRKIKCNSCNGDGRIKVDNGCSKCKGAGQISVSLNNPSFVFMQNCDKCMGKIKAKPCDLCNCSGLLEVDVNLAVSIPGGVSNNSVLRIANMGNYTGQFMGGETFKDVHLHISVQKDPNFKLEGDVVVSTIQINLLDAIKGVTKKVNTVVGEKEIIIPPLTKHSDTILIPNAGVNRKGFHKVILDVQYPKDTSKLINVLI